MTRRVVDVIREAAGRKPDGKEMEETVRFLSFNHFFGAEVRYEDGQILTDDEGAGLLKERLELFFEHHGKPAELKAQLLFDMLSVRLPDTAGKLEKWVEMKHPPVEIRYYVLDFLNFAINKEIIDFTDEDVEDLIKSACYALNVACTKAVAEFLSWVKYRYHVGYVQDAIVHQRADRSAQIQAYDAEFFLRLYYYLFNREYHRKEGVMKRIGTSRETCNAYLYLCLHCLKAIRDTDLKRIPFARLRYSPKETLERIADGTYRSDEAVRALETVINRLQVIPLRPHKTMRSSGISNIAFYIPKDVRSFIGRLLAARAAYHVLEGEAEDAPFVTPVREFTKLKKLLPHELAELFRKENFRSISATKSVLQCVQDLAREVLGEDAGLVSVKCITLASRARSHKGDVGSFARSTFVYLRDCKFTGLTPDAVAYTLLQRNPLSFVSSLLLNMVTDGQYGRLTVDAQTTMIGALDMPVSHIERVTALVERSYDAAVNTVHELLQSCGDEREMKIMQLLFRIGNGDAPAKETPYDCILAAAHKPCPYDGKSCGGCGKSVMTEATLYYLADELVRLKLVYRSSDNPFEQRQAAAIATSRVIPLIGEIMECAEAVYGTEERKRLEDIVMNRKKEVEQ